MVSMASYRDAYKLYIPMQWPMVTAMVMMNSEQKKFRTRYRTSANMTIQLVLKEIENDHRAYRIVAREVHHDCTKAIIRITFTERRPTQTLPNAESRDAEIYICNVQSGFPRAEARSYHVYHLEWSPASHI